MTRRVMSTRFRPGVATGATRGYPSIDGVT